MKVSPDNTNYLTIVYIDGVKYNISNVMVTNVDVTITFTTTLNPIPMMSEESGLPNVNLIFENNLMFNFIC